MSKQMPTQTIDQSNIFAYPANSVRLYDRIAEAIRYISSNQADQPDLDTLASHVGMSPHHFQRTFSDWAGVSPKKFLKTLTLNDAKQRLRASESVLDASFGAGLSGPGRLHDLFITTDAVTPGEYKSRGEGMTFYYGLHPSPFGPCLIVVNDRGLSGLSFIEEGAQDPLTYQRNQWENADWVRDEARTESYMDRIFFHSEISNEGQMKVLLRGSPFRVKVWEALLQIPSGTVTSYGALADRLGRPGAARAVAGAVANNLVGVVIPCHRVIRESGALAGYRWGETRKAALLGVEAVHANSMGLENTANNT